MQECCHMILCHGIYINNAMSFEMTKYNFFCDNPFEANDPMC